MVGKVFIGYNDHEFVLGLGFEYNPGVIRSFVIDCCIYYYFRSRTSQGLAIGESLNSLEFSRLDSR